MEENKKTEEKKLNNNKVLDYADWFWITITLIIIIVFLFMYSSEISEILYNSFWFSKHYSWSWLFLLIWILIIWFLVSIIILYKKWYKDFFWWLISPILIGLSVFSLFVWMCNL